MRHQNSVFHGLLKHVPWSFFDRLVDEHKGDSGVRRLTTKSQFVALLYGQLSGASSLREIELGLRSHACGLYHLGAHEVQRSTLADANALRPHAIFTRLFTRMALAGSRGLRRATTDAVRLIDATSVRLAGVAGEWARLSKGVQGAKAHIVYDPDAATPVYLEVTPARVNDIVVAKRMPIEPGASYVFDLGYYDFAWWAELDAKGCRIVTRLKVNTPLRPIEERAVPDGSGLAYDRVGLLPARLAGARKNPLPKPVREIGVRLDGPKASQDRVLRVFSNDLDAPASEIAALYKRRWAIELFFRWVKQTLRIKHFVGRSENAVRIQIAVALIAYILLKMAHEAAGLVQSTLAFARLIRANLMQKRPINQLLNPKHRPPLDTGQIAFQWNAT
ncbi:MAG: IS4 family transposase [Nitrospiraceae bacterium]|nr:IS4 family transposase [Nitrospiraceae bacterium]